MAWHRVVRRGDGMQVGRRDGVLLRSFLKRTARWRTPRGACLTASDCRRAFLAGCSAEAPQMASANTVCRIFIDLRRAMQNWMQQLLSLQQRCSFVLRFVLGLTAAAYPPALRLAKKRRVIRCVTRSCDQNSPRRLGAERGVCLQTGAARLLESCQGREQRYRTPSWSAGLLSTPPACAARRRATSGRQLQG